MPSNVEPVNHEERITPPNGQSHDLSGYCRMFGGYDLHFRIHWDRSYSNQSSASVSVWSQDTLQWQMVAHLLPQNVTGLDEAYAKLTVLAKAILMGDDQS